MFSLFPLVHIILVAAAIRALKMKDISHISAVHAQRVVQLSSAYNSLNAFTRSLVYMRWPAAFTTGPQSDLVIPLVLFNYCFPMLVLSKACPDYLLLVDLSVGIVEYMLGHIGRCPLDRPCFGFHVFVLFHISVHMMLHDWW